MGQIDEYTSYEYQTMLKSNCKSPNIKILPIHKTVGQCGNVGWVPGQGYVVVVCWGWVRIKVNHKMA